MTIYFKKWFRHFMGLSPVGFQYNIDIRDMSIDHKAALGNTQAIFEQIGMPMQNNVASRRLCPKRKTAVSQQQ